MVITVTHKQTKRNYTIEARSSGDNAIVCPVCAHDRKKKGVKSLSYNRTKQVGKCHHCEAVFYEKTERYLPEMREKQYERPVWRNVTQLSDNVVKWFASRGISQQALIEAKVTEGRHYMPQEGKEMNCIEFNYFRDGELVNVKRRDAKKNFALHKGAELIFYNLDAVKGQKEVFCVEGEMDALSLIEAGIKNVVSVPNGATKGSARLEYLDNCWQEFEHLEKIYIATDNDEPGRALREELARRLGKERCAIVDFGQYKDANEVLMADRTALDGFLKGATDYPIEGIRTFDDLRKNVYDLKKNGLKRGAEISNRDFNEHLTFVPGYVTVITGIPNHGKGEVLDQILVDLAYLHDWPFGIFSPENLPHELHVSKLFSKVAAEGFDEASMNTIELFLQTYEDKFFMIDPPEDLTLDSILNYGAVLVKKYGIKGLVIDPWNKLDHQWTDSERAHISRSLDKIDNFARKFGVHVFIVAHPTKLQKDRDTKKTEVPSLYSISGTADWFNKCANGIVVYRNWYDDGTSDTDVHIQKVKFKHWGKQGIVNWAYDYVTGRYSTKGLPNRKSYLPEVKQADVFTQPYQKAVKPNEKFMSTWEDDGDGYNHITPTEDAPF